MHQRLVAELAVSGRYPKTLAVTRRYLESELGIHVIRFHRCVNNCMVFIGDNFVGDVNIVILRDF